MIDALSMFSDELAEKFLEGADIPEDLIHTAVREGTLSREFVPVFVGSAYKNKGVQPLLDAVQRYLPAPSDVENIALDLDNNEAEVVLKSDPAAPTVALAFKLEDGQYGQLTYVRVYQGTVKKGDELYNIRTKKNLKSAVSSECMLIKQKTLQKADAVILLLYSVLTVHQAIHL